MASAPQPYRYHDSLYGEVQFGQPFASLIHAPIVQRLRHVRLSNIDSIDMPGMSNLSRFEHVLGVAYLASLVGFRKRLSAVDLLTLDAAALLHDWAITSFGHLVEEAFQYAGAAFQHELHLSALSRGELGSDILGLDHRQILAGREMGLKDWAERSTGSAPIGSGLIANIADHIQGEGAYGRVIAGTIDLDNIDNVTRMAYHLGLIRDGSVAVRLAAAIVDVDAQTRAPVFDENAVEDIRSWLETRRAVYNLLMLSERDFAGKLMLLYATSTAYEAGEITPQDWAWTDIEFYSTLRNSKIASVRDAADRWYAGELWETVPLSWFSGSRPAYPELKAFSEALSDHLGRHFFAYGIKDKRDRKLLLNIGSKGPVSFGADSRQWLLGFGSPLRQPISKRDAEKGWAFAESFFGSRRVGDAVMGSEVSAETCLI